MRTVTNWCRAYARPMTDGARYTHGHHESVLRSHRWRTAANSAAYLLDHLRPGMSLLDIGCGPGTITVDLARAVAPGQVLGVDTAPEVIDLAARDAQDALGAGPPNLSFAVADVYALDARDDTFDVVHAHQVLQHVPDPVRALREMRRVCAPDGLVAARDSDYAAFAWYPADPLLDEWLARYCEVARADGGEPAAGRHLLAWARAAGCSDVRGSASAWCFASPEDRAWWGGLWADRVTSSRLAERLRDSGCSTADLEDLAAAWRAWAASPDAWFAVLHGEILARP
jgi:SAM-dependent methyltransferase